MTASSAGSSLLSAQIRDFPDDLQMVVASSKRDRLRGRLASRRPLVCGQ
jgi:hypothetical protein